MSTGRVRLPSVLGDLRVARTKARRLVVREQRVLIDQMRDRRLEHNARDPEQLVQHGLVLSNRGEQQSCPRLHQKAHSLRIELPDIARDEWRINYNEVKAST
eukprot:Amastigsp_a619_32.p3 type:complete len:102 gc:universal Amastigsp_a619_32:650-345(-)